MIRFSLSVAHCPWIPARVDNLREMLSTLLPLSKDIPYLCHDTDYRGRKWVDVKYEWALKSWSWHLEQDVTHCVLLSDDLSVVPEFFSVLDAMVHACPVRPIGLMTNHPDAPRLYEDGHHWYKTNSWLVGPGIVMPKPMLAAFVAFYQVWYPKLKVGKDEQGYREWYHDDSSINEWVTKYQSGYSLHPVPAPIEHQLRLGRSHDEAPFPPYAAESISWRRVWHDNPRTFSELPAGLAGEMKQPSFWFGASEAPMLKVPGVK